MDRGRMKRQIGKLTAAVVRHAAKPGLQGDGGGLWLNVGPNGGKSWLYRYMLDGRAREMGLGPLHTIGLAEARERARAARRLCLDGIDPIDRKHAERDARRLAAASAVTFKDCAAKYIAANRAGWRNAKHAAQWDATLATYAYPIIGALPVASIDTRHLTKLLEPIWQTKPQTAHRVRGRIEAVLDYALAHRWRTAANCARWRNHLENVLPKPARIRHAQHHAALPWREVPVFWTALVKQEGIPALALRFLILTAARSGEVLGCRWPEIDAQRSLWVLLAIRTKSAKEHRIPLGEAALAVLREVRSLRDGDPNNDFVFPGRTGPLGHMAMLRVMRAMGHGDLTVHGFRSCFRDWCGEQGEPADISEAALGHALGNRTQLAYMRGDLLERRRRLMARWADFCGRVVPAEGGDVVALRA
jgi:integrase